MSFQFPALAAAATVWAAAAGLPGSARAQTAAAARPAQTTRSVHLRAGPSRDYPAIGVLPRGTTVWVEGCLRDISWCDVTAGTERGWIYAMNLSFEVQGELVPVPKLAPEIGIGIIGFLLGSYWGEHYRDRPWYAERDRWHRPPPPLQPTPPRRHIPPAPPSPPAQASPGTRPHPPGLGQPPGHMLPPQESRPPEARPRRMEPPAGPSRPPQRPPSRGPDEKDEVQRRNAPPGQRATP